MPVALVSSFVQIACYSGYNLSNYKVISIQLASWCAVASPVQTSGPSSSSLLNNILNFKVIFQPLLITSLSHQGRIVRNQCRVSVVLMVKMKSIMFPLSSQLSLHHIVSGRLYALLANIQIASHPEYRVVDGSGGYWTISIKDLQISV